MTIILSSLDSKSGNIKSRGRGSATPSASASASASAGVSGTSTPLPLISSSGTPDANLNGKGKGKGKKDFAGSKAERAKKWLGKGSVVGEGLTGRDSANAIDRERGKGGGEGVQKDNTSQDNGVVTRGATRNAPDGTVDGPASRDHEDSNKKDSEDRTAAGLAEMTSQARIQ